MSGKYLQKMLQEKGRFYRNPFLAGKAHGKTRPCATSWGCLLDDLSIYFQGLDSIARAARGVWILERSTRRKPKKSLGFIRKRFQKISIFVLLPNKKFPNSLSLVIFLVGFKKPPIDPAEVSRWQCPFLLAPGIWTHWFPEKKHKKLRSWGK